MSQCKNALYSYPIQRVIYSEDVYAILKEVLGDAHFSISH
jgi:hypothetical protein